MLLDAQWPCVALLERIEGFCEETVLLVLAIVIVRMTTVYSECTLQIVEFVVGGRERSMLFAGVSANAGLSFCAYNSRF